jgi:4'-phosphopantetheinyl transferase
MTACRVWWAGLGEGERLDGLLDAPERERLRGLRHAADRARVGLGSALLRVAAAEWLGCAPLDVPVERTCARCGRPHGRPRLPGTGLEASVSHSGGRVAVALADGVAVGVDVEAYRPDLDVAGLARSVLVAAEAAAVQEREGAEQQTRAFLVLWTRKEALLKAVGCGLTVSPAAVRVSSPGEPPRLLGWPPGAGRPRPTTLCELAPGGAHVASLAVLATAAEVVQVRAASPLGPSAPGTASCGRRGRAW